VLGGGPYSYFRYQAYLAALNAIEVFAEIGRAFGERFGRPYDLLDTYRSDDAELVFVMLGSFASKAKDAVDHLRQAGQAVGLVRPRLLRPFPQAALRQALAGKRGVAVIDQNLAPGGGVLYGDVATALYHQPAPRPVLASFIGGLGGRDIGLDDLLEIAAATRQAAATGEPPAPRLLLSAAELREVRKLQAIAGVQSEPGGRQP
jgi:pyruvate ferredoxin oxidoreductase alpha subunit